MAIYTLWLKLVTCFLLYSCVIGQNEDKRTNLQKELGLSGINIGAKAADPRSERPLSFYSQMEGGDALFESAIVQDFTGDLQQIIQECETNPAPAQGQFVQVQGTQFTYGGNPFYFMGMNSYHLHNLELNLKQQKPQAVADTFKSAQDLGIQVVRLWAFSEGIRKSTTQFDEGVFQALDSIIAQAKQYNIKLVLALMNYWEQFDGTDSQVALRYGTIKGYTIENFFIDEDVKLLYKSQACKIINRDNTVNGIKYRDDPTIMAWDLMNEARCNDCRGRSQYVDQLGGLIAEWMEEMSAFVKSLDPNHLLTSGSEGFFGRTSPQQVLNSNPGSWGQCTGDDFVLIHSNPNIDYATMHVYPLHKTYDFVIDGPCDMGCLLDWLPKYLKAHFEEATNKLGKPVVIEEFGLSIEERNQIRKFNANDKLDLFKRVYGMFLQNAQNGDSCGGVMFWTAAVDKYQDFDGFTVYIDENQPTEESTLTADTRSIELLNTFRLKNRFEECSEEEYNRGFFPNAISSIPPFIILQGNNVVDVIRNAYKELQEYGVIVSLASPTSAPPIQLPVPALQDGCNREDLSAISGEAVRILRANTFEGCCEACQNEESCNAFFFCEKQLGCFERFIYIPFRSCDLLFSQQIDQGQQPLFSSQGADTQLTSGYL